MGKPAVGAIQSPDQSGNQLYPFEDRANATSQDGVFADPSIFLDARLWFPSKGPNFYVGKLSKTLTAINISLFEGLSEVATGEVTQYNQTEVRMLDRLGRQIGVFIINAAKLFALMQGRNELVFNRDALPLTSFVSIPIPSEWVEGIETETGVGSGDLWLIGQDGVVLSVGDSNDITVNIVGDPLFRRKACVDSGVETFTTPRPLRKLMLNSSVSELVPDVYGNIQFDVIGADAGDQSILRVESIENGIRLLIIGV